MLMWVLLMLLLLWSLSSTERKHAHTAGARRHGAKDRLCARRITTYTHAHWRGRADRQQLFPGPRSTETRARRRGPGVSLKNARPQRPARALHAPSPLIDVTQPVWM